MKWIKPLGIALAACLVIAAFVYIQGMAKYYKAYQNTTRLQLDMAVDYNKDCQKQMQKIKKDNISFVLWNAKRNVNIKNVDYSRSTMVDSIGVAGDTSCLFPGGNSLQMEDTDYCLLGTHTSEVLFGSIQSVGRKIVVDGKEYKVAGVVYQISDLFVYELDAQAGETVTDMLYRFENKTKGQVIGQKLLNVYGFGGEEQKQGWSGIKAYFDNI